MRTEIRLFRRGNRLVHAPAPMRWSLTSTMRSSLILNEIQNRSRTICHYGVGDVIGVVKRFRLHLGVLVEAILDWKKNNDRFISSICNLDACWPMLRDGNYV